MRRGLLPALLLLPGLAFGETCPAIPQGAVPETMQSMVRRGHQTRFAARLDAIQDQLRSGPWPVIALGDSIVQRWPADLLQQALGSRVLNAGVGGDGTAQTLWRLANMDWSGQSPRQVLILIGTNDGGRSEPCAVYQGIRAVVAKARQLFPAAQVTVVGILPRGPEMRQREPDSLTTNRALAEAASHSGFRLLDAFDAFRCGQRTDCELVVPPTNVHPTRRGYEVLGELLRRHLMTR